MTMGKGKILGEIPSDEIKKTKGFHLWVNLDADLKLIDPNLELFEGKNLPTITVSPGVVVKVISGNAFGFVSPI